MVYKFVTGLHPLAINHPGHYRRKSEAGENPMPPPWTFLSIGIEASLATHGLPWTLGQRFAPSPIQLGGRNLDNSSSDFMGRC